MYSDEAIRGKDRKRGYFILPGNSRKRYNRSFVSAKVRRYRRAKMSGLAKEILCKALPDWKAEKEAIQSGMEV